MTKEQCVKRIISYITASCLDCPIKCGKDILSSSVCENNRASQIYDLVAQAERKRIYEKLVKLTGYRDFCGTRYDWEDFDKEFTECSENLKFEEINETPNIEK
jgi:hypothetical protein